MALGGAAVALVAGTTVAGTVLPAAAATAAPAARVQAPRTGAAAGLPASSQSPARGAVQLLVAKRATAASGLQSSRERVSHSVPRAHHPHQRLAQHRPCGQTPLDRWICNAEKIMASHGIPRSALDTGAARIVVMHESGGNPHASNGWDANAAAGTPSEGIAQTIQPTFTTYAVPGHHNIWNPVDNMVAAFRYAISRYGSMSNIPGVIAVRHGGTYVGY